MSEQEPEDLTDDEVKAIRDSMADPLTADENDPDVN